MDTQQKARMLTARRRHANNHRRMTLFCRSVAEVGASGLSQSETAFN
ncbi:MAG: hypothetical protein J7641_14610 [Cyanobacteria bacterium SID2]|nr:hypothetical protein [Cyanobacteria bacterium SID2]MBP0005148.1 hypothetical protein [Cyanobacteria bacterium SBC]